MADFIAKPPPSRAGSPYIRCSGGASRYALTRDTKEVTDHSIVEDPAQYDILAISSGLERFIVKTAFTPNPPLPPATSKFNIQAEVNSMPVGGVYAGMDWPTSNANTNKLTNPCGGSALVVTPEKTLRSASWRGGVVTPGAHNAYTRLILRDPMKVPFIFMGSIKLKGRLNNLVIHGENRVPTWVWGVNFHPVFVDEDNNVVSGFAPGGDHWSASGQINKVYGIPRASLFSKKPFYHDAQLGNWHQFKMVIPKIGHHQIFWDDQLVYEVTEKTPPASWWNKPLKAGLRLDFYDFELMNLHAASY